MNKKILFLVCFLFSILITQTSTAQAEGEPLTLENVTVHKVQSFIVPNQIYELRVGLPVSYQSSPDKAYPVVFILDGQWSFTLASEIAGNLAEDTMIPEIISVGITWGGEGDDPGFLRMRDFIRPELPYLPVSGGADLFLSAITEELIPYVENRYRTGGKKVLVGGSLGGLFTSYAMLEKPRTFDGFIATAGSYFMDMSYFDEKLSLIYGSADLKRVRSFMSVGNLDDNEPYVKALHDALDAAELRGFKNKYKVFKGVGHAGAEPLALTRGLLYVFKKPVLKLSEEFLQRYAGVYEGGMEGYPPFQVTVSVAGKGRILIEGEDSREYLAESESMFYVKGIAASAEFPQVGQLIINSGGTLLYFDHVEQ